MAAIKHRIKRAMREFLGRLQESMEPRAPSETGQPRSFEEQIYFSAVLRGDICFDVGANLGDASLLLSRLTGTGGSVIAFEPVWPLYMKLCGNVQKGASGSGASVVTVPLGLADTEKTATVQVPGGDFGLGSLAKAEDWSKVRPGKSIKSYECRFATLDGFLKSTKLPAPDFLKIDVEGAELFVLRGAAGFFKEGNRPIMLIELIAPWERAFNYGPWDVLSLLTGFGYSFLFACPDGLVEHVPSKSNPFPPEYEQGYNVLAFHPSKHAKRIKSIDQLRAGEAEPILPMQPGLVPNRLA